MKNNFIYSVLGLLVLVSSCKTTHVKFSSKDSASRQISETPILQTPLLVDLDVNETKVTGQFSGENISLQYAKNMALADAVRKANVDVLVEPIFEVEVDDKATNVTVKGFPGKYKNFRKPELSDTLYNKFRVLGHTESILRVQKPNATPTNNLFECDKMLADGKVIMITGVSVIGLGAGTFLTGIILTSGNNDVISKGDAVPLYIVGGVLALAGAITAPIGVSMMKKGKACRKINGMSESISDLQLAPVVNPISQNYGMGMSFKF